MYYRGAQQRSDMQTKTPRGSPLPYRAQSGRAAWGGGSSCGGAMAGGNGASGWSTPRPGGTPTTEKPEGPPAVVGGCETHPRPPRQDLLKGGACPMSSAG